MSNATVPVVPGMSSRNLDHLARHILERFEPHALVEPMATPIDRFVEIDFVDAGIARLHITEEAIYGVEGLTTVENGQVVIRLPLSTLEGAVEGQGRDRFTLAHEGGTRSSMPTSCIVR